MKKKFIVLLLIFAANSAVFGVAEDLYYNGAYNSNLWVEDVASWSLEDSSAPVDLSTDDTLYVNTNAGSMRSHYTRTYYKWLFGDSSASNYILSDVGKTTNTSDLTVTRVADAVGVINQGTYKHTVNGVTYLSNGGGNATLNVGKEWAANGGLVLADTAGGQGTLTVANGALFTSTTDMTLVTGGTGTLTVNTGGTFTNTSKNTVLSAGSSAVGTMNIGGAYTTGTTTLASVSGAQGTLNVTNGGVYTNSGSSTLVTGGTGNLTVNAGGTVTNAGSTTLAAGSSAVGTMNINGAYTTTTTTLATTSGAQGTLNINNGGVYTNTATTIFTTGGTGTINVNSGGTLNNNTGSNLADAGAVGVVNISAGGSYNVSGTGWFAIGRYGDGTFNNSGFLGDSTADRTRSRILIAQYSGAVGNLNVTDGTVRISRLQFDVEAGTNGTLTISGNSVLDVASTSASYDAGLVLGSVTVGGTAYSGYGVAKLVLNGSHATVNASRLTMDALDTLQFVLDGANGVGTGIVLTNEATLAGILDISFDSTAVEGTYTLLKAASITTSDFLLSAAPEWSYGVVDVEGGQELRATYAIPEPATISLLAMGIMGLFVRRGK